MYAPLTFRIFLGYESVRLLTLSLFAGILREGMQLRMRTYFNFAILPLNLFWLSGCQITYWLGLQFYSFDQIVS